MSEVDQAIKHLENAIDALKRLSAGVTPQEGVTNSKRYALANISVAISRLAEDEI